ncbi:MAG: hypothetical protein M1826_005441 [Phylliscum demangeonii]|nr:MAG: hypothetical protein M1826_005441 [Phylliscum demangeonii]
MAWARAEPASAPPPASALSKLLPLLVLLTVLGAFAFVGYHVWSMAHGVAHATGKKLEKKDVYLSRDGVKVGVKEVQNERYVDQTQGVLVKAWNLARTSPLKSRSGNQQ